MAPFQCPHHFVEDALPLFLGQYFGASRSCYTLFLETMTMIALSYYIVPLLCSLKKLYSRLTPLVFEVGIGCYSPFPCVAGCGGVGQSDLALLRSTYLGCGHLLF